MHPRTSNLRSEILEDLWSLVRSIPKGKVTSYGALGSALKRPSSGYMVGRWMAQCPDGLPWWRVVGKNGEMRTAARDPELAELQRRRLRAEKVRMIGDVVDMSAHQYVP